MDYRDIYKNWLASGALTADEKAELSAISDDLNAQKDRFGAELEFGTAGMRGGLGAMSSAAMAAQDAAAENPPVEEEIP